MSRLQIYITEGCIGCQWAMSMAEAVQNLYPDLEVEVIDIADTTEALPEEVIAVPAYVLNGRLIFLGNPHLDELHQTLLGVVNDVPPTST